MHGLCRLSMLTALSDGPLYFSSHTLTPVYFGGFQLHMVRSTKAGLVRKGFNKEHSSELFRRLQKQFQVRLPKITSGACFRGCFEETCCFCTVRKPPDQKHLLQLHFLGPSFLCLRQAAAKSRSWYECCWLCHFALLSPTSSLIQQAVYSMVCFSIGTLVQINLTSCQWQFLLVVHCSSRAS